MLKLNTILFCFLTCLMSIQVKAEISKPAFIEKVKISAPEDVISYWEYYSSIQDIREVNSMYVKIGDLLTTKRLKLINDIAYVKCVVELSVLNKSFELLRNLKPQIKKDDNYLKGCYYLVFSRLLNRVDRFSEAIESNKKAITDKTLLTEIAS